MKFLDRVAEKFPVRGVSGEPSSVDGNKVLSRNAEVRKRHPERGGFFFAIDSAYC